MDRTAAFTGEDAHYKAQAQSRLTEARRILRHLSVERERAQRQRVKRPNLLSELKAILH